MGQRLGTPISGNLANCTGYPGSFATLTVTTLNATGESSIGVGGALAGRTLTLSSTGQPALAFLSTGSAAGSKTLGLIYDGGGALGAPGIVIQNLGDTGGFVANSGVIWRDGALTLGSITRPNGGAGGLAVGSAVASTSSTTGAATVGGGLGVAGAVWAGTYAATTPVAVGSLPAASAGLTGARMFVTDASATTFASIVANGGANKVPVYCDGTNWRIG